MKYEILMDRYENPRKCTIAPLSDREDFTIRYFGTKDKVQPFSSAYLLHVDGIPLPDLKGAVPSVAAIDCVWKRVPTALRLMDGPLPPLAVIPKEFVTAYPRRNKQGLDPDGGLATIEALFIAAAFGGVWDETLLSHYYFAKPFLELNSSQWKKYGLGPNAST